MRTVPAIVLLALLASCGGESPQEEAKSDTPAASPAAETGAPARPVSFALCSMCHSDQKDKVGIGPSLFGVVGRKSGTMAGYSYSPAMQAANLQWDEQTLDSFIRNPREIVPGTKMSYAGLADAEKRAEIIAYLGTLK